MAEQQSSGSRTIDTTCCVVGGGPAGMMLGLLLARAGVDVQVLEKHADFLRDFRGDTIHPSTLELMYELGVLEEFLKRPHQKAAQVSACIGDTEVALADFSHLPTHCKFLALMPQWEFLDFLAQVGRRYPTFHVQMRAEATALVEEGGRTKGVRASTPDGPLEIHANLVVGADGRHSTVRRAAGFVVTDIGAPMDVLWLRLPRESGDTHQLMGRVNRGRFFIMLDRSDYWQCGYVIPKGTLDQLKARGLDSFRADIAEIAPQMASRLGAIRDWNDVKLLTVSVERLETWSRPGLLCIGDAAHTMSPVGGVGINLAIQDAVATANLLASPLREGRLTHADLASVQRRRQLPTVLTQKIQVLIQNRVISAVLGERRELKLPFPVRMLRRFPYLRRFPARLVGMGFRPEHVRTPEFVAK